MGIRDDVAVDMVMAFRKETMKTFLSLMQNEALKLWEVNVIEDILLEFVNSGYVLEGLLPTSWEYIGKRYFVQELPTYRRRLRWIF